MANYCGISQWQQNSQIVHAVSSDVLGPYTEKELIAEAFAHEPCVTKDPNTGQYMMVSLRWSVDAQRTPVRRFQGTASAFSVSMLISTPAVYG